MSARRVGFRPLFSLVGMVAGIIGGLGVVAMLHQQGAIYPTRNVAILGAVLGLVWGILVPSLLRWIRVNRRLAKA